MSGHEQYIDVIKECCKSLNILRSNVEERIENLKICTEKWIRHDGDNTPAELLVTFEQYMYSQYSSLYTKLTKNPKYKNAKAQLSAIKGSKKAVGGKKVTSSPPSSAEQTQTTNVSDKDMGIGLQNIKKQQQQRKMQTESQQLQEIKKTLSDHLTMKESEMTDVTVMDVIERILSDHKKAELELQKITEALADQCKQEQKKLSQPSPNEIILDMKRKISYLENEIKKIGDELGRQENEKKKAETQLSPIDLVIKMNSDYKKAELELQKITEVLADQYKEDPKKRSQLSPSEIILEMTKKTGELQNEIKKIRDELGGQGNEKKKQETQLSTIDLVIQMKNENVAMESQIEKLKEQHSSQASAAETGQKQSQALQQILEKQSNELQKIKKVFVERSKGEKRVESEISADYIIDWMNSNHKKAELELQKITEALADQCKEDPQKLSQSSPSEIILDMKKKISHLENQMKKIVDELSGQGNGKRKSETQLSPIALVIEMKKENAAMGSEIEKLKKQHSYHASAAKTDQKKFQDPQQILQQQSNELQKIKKAFVERSKGEKKVESDISADYIINWMNRLQIEKDQEASVLREVRQELGLDKVSEEGRLSKSQKDSKRDEGEKNPAETIHDMQRFIEDAKHQIIVIYAETFNLPENVADSQPRSSLQRKCEEILRKIQDDHAKMKQQEEQLRKLHVERESALHRLSEVAGAKLTDGNPNISDLSDPNRPTKIGEQYNELYDNLWTDAYDQLMKNKVKERDAVKLLVEILEESYRYCQTTASKQQIRLVADLAMVNMSGVEKHVGQEKRPSGTLLTNADVTKLLVMAENPNAGDQKEFIKTIYQKLGLTDVDFKQLKNMIRQSADCTSPVVQQGYIRHISEELRKQQKIDKQLDIYAQKCAHVCWLMLAQDPPVCLRPWKNDVNSPFEKEVYKEYTSSGSVLDFVVWPALCLHESGPLLRKGVAQPKSGAGPTKVKKK